MECASASSRSRRGSRSSRGSGGGWRLLGKSASLRSRTRDSATQTRPELLAAHLHRPARMGNLLWLIIVILIVLWLVGGFALNIGGNLIHILLVIALILVVYRLATGRKVL